MSDETCLILHPDIVRTGPVTSDVSRGMGLAQFVGVWHAAWLPHTKCWAAVAWLILTVWDFVWALEIAASDSN